MEGVAGKGGGTRHALTGGDSPTAENSRKAQRGTRLGNSSVIRGIQEAKRPEGKSSMKRDKYYLSQQIL